MQLSDVIKQLYTQTQPSVSNSLHVLLFFQLETEKNKLENLLHNNLNRKLERLQAELSEGSGEDRKQKLDMYSAELESVNGRISENNGRFKGGWKYGLDMFYS